MFNSRSSLHCLGGWGGGREKEMHCIQQSHAALHCVDLHVHGCARACPEVQGIADLGAGPANTPCVSVTDCQCYRPVAVRAVMQAEMGRKVSLRHRWLFEVLSIPKFPS